MTMSPSAETAQTAPGHPRDHQPDPCRLALNYCRLGATDEQLAALFDVPVATVGRWTAELPDFAEAVEHGRAMADAEVRFSLYRRAVGYDKTLRRVVTGRGETRTTTWTRHHPPNVEACVKWLSERQPGVWRPRGIARGRRQAFAATMANVFLLPLLPHPSFDAGEADGNALGQRQLQDEQPVVPSGTDRAVARLDALARQAAFARGPGPSEPLPGEPIPPRGTEHGIATGGARSRELEGVP